MHPTAYDYAGIPKTQKKRKNIFLLIYLMLGVISISGIVARNAALAVIPLFACVLVRIYDVLVSRPYLHRFAKDNSLVVYDYPKLQFTELPFFNKIYHIASVSRGIQLQLGPPLIEIFTYTTVPLWRAEKFQVTHIKLTRTLPNVILDSRKNDYLLGSDLPGNYTEQTDAYNLEGDFPKYFKVYADAEQSTTTLQLLSPDLMAVLIDSFADSNIEFVNSSVFITTRTKFVNQSTFKHLIESVDELSTRLENKAGNTLHVPNVYHDRISVPSH